jgi:hypothetical protein
LTQKIPLWFDVRDLGYGRLFAGYYLTMRHELGQEFQLHLSSQFGGDELVVGAPCELIALAWLTRRVSLIPNTSSASMQEWVYTADWESDVTNHVWPGVVCDLCWDVPSSDPPLLGNGGWMNGGWALVETPFGHVLTDPAQLQEFTKKNATTHMTKLQIGDHVKFQYVSLVVQAIVNR